MRSRLQGSQRFCAVLGVVIFGYALLHGIVYFLFTEPLLKNAHGDLARLGYLKLDLRQAEQLVSNYQEERKFLTEREFFAAESPRKVQVITLGDSFLNGGGNTYLQNALVQRQGLQVLNLPALRQTTELETVLLLARAGLLQAAQPKVVIVECVERNLVRKYGKELSLNQTVTLAEVRGQYLRPQRDEHWEAGVINAGNNRFLLYSALYPFSDNAVIGPVYQTRLSKPLFQAGQDSDRLLFFKEEINNNKHATAADVEMIHLNFNRAAAELARYGIQLWLLPAPDKSTVYQEYMVNSAKYEKPDILGALAAKPEKQYRYIPTQQILREAARQGVLDLYWPGDTHWGPNGVAAVLEGLYAF